MGFVVGELGIRDRFSLKVVLLFLGCCMLRLLLVVVVRLVERVRLRFRLCLLGLVVKKGLNRWMCVVGGILGLLLCMCRM